MIIKMDIYGNNRHVFTITLNGFCRTDNVNLKLQQKLIKSGDTMIGGLSMGGNKISSVLGPTAVQNASTKIYSDTISTLKVSKNGDSMGGS